MYGGGGDECGCAGLEFLIGIPQHGLLIFIVNVRASYIYGLLSFFA